jgi:hypothetical protein
MGGKTGRDSLMEIKEKPHNKTQAIMERRAYFLEILKVTIIFSCWFRPI